MRIQKYYINVPPPIIYLGKVGEQNYVKFEFDVSPWTKEYSDGEISVRFLRHDLKTGYPVDVTINGDIVSWQPSVTDLAVSGEGKLQLWITSGETAGSSCIIKTQTDPSLSSIGDRPPVPPPDWALEVLEAKKVSERAEQNSTAAAEDAGRSAEAAKRSEDNAGASEIEAKASEEAAKSSEVNAGASERNAKASEDAAKASEINAKGSEDQSKVSEINSKASEVNSKASETNSAESELAASQALLDLLAMLGTQVATLDANGKLTAGQIPPIAINDTFPVANTSAMTALTAQRGDVALIIAGSVVTDSYILTTDDPTSVNNWSKLGVSYVAEAGHALQADTAGDAGRINGHRVITMSQEQYDIAVLDSETVYLVY